MLAASSSHAIGVTGPAGDVLPGQTGRQRDGLDLLAGVVACNACTDNLVFLGRTAHGIGLTAHGLPACGINPVAGTARLAANRISGVLMDAVVIFNADGAGTVNRLGGPTGAQPHQRAASGMTPR